MAKKLLIINITCNQGSTGKISEQIGGLMQEREWDVYLAHGARRVNSSKLKTIPFSNMKVEFFHALKSLLFDSDGLGSICTTKKLIKKIKEMKPDIIQLNNLHGYFINYKILFKYLNSTDIPIVMTLHDCWAFTGHCTHFEGANCNRWLSKCYNCPLKLKRPKVSLLFDRSKRNFEYKKKYLGCSPNLNIIAVSEWIGNLAEQSILKNHQINIFHNGIDLSVFKPYDKNKSNTFTILGVANVWYEDKGLNDIYELRKQLPLDKYQIILVGLSERQIKKLPKGIVGIRRTSNQTELAKLYSDANVLVNPTYADTFPTVNLEALACGTPVVTYKTGGSPEAIDEKTGIVVEQGNVNALVDAIKQIQEFPFLSENCRSRAEQLFNKDKCFEKYIDLYEKIIQCRCS